MLYGLLKKAETPKCEIQDLDYHQQARAMSLELLTPVLVLSSLPICKMEA